MTRHSIIRSQSRQRGATLMVALILLAVMTLLGLAVLRSTIMDERMAGGMYGRSLAFQSAEAGLREAENLIETNTALPASFPTAAGTCNANGLCAAIDRTANPNAEDLWVSGATWKTSAASVGMAKPPQYIIEKMGEAPTWYGCDKAIPIAPTCLSERYRITAVSQSDDGSRVLLQSNYAVVK